MLKCLVDVGFIMHIPLGKSSLPPTHKADTCNTKALQLDAQKIAEGIGYLETLTEITQKRMLRKESKTH